MKSSKRWLSLALCGSVFLSMLAGCAGAPAPADSAAATDPAASSNQSSASAPAASSKPTGEKETLRVAWWGNTERDKLYYQINDLFMAQNPNVEIVTESPGWNDYWVSMATAYASGSAPDVVQFQSNQIGEYCSKNVLTPLEPFVENKTINLDGWNMNLVDTGKYEDKLYMITLGITAQTMYVNKTMLDSIGVELWDFEEDITWEAFEKYLNDVQAKLPKGTYAGMDFYYNNDLAWLWIRQNSTGGVEWVDEKGQFAPTKETLTSWYSLSDRLRKSGAFPPSTWFQEWNTKPWQEGALVSGKVAFLLDNANRYKMFSGSTEDELVIRKVPINDKSENAHGDLMITSAFGISESAKNKELAAQYINFFANNEEAQKIFNMELGVPGSLTIQKALSANADPSDVKAMDYLNMISETAPAFVAKAPGVWAIQNEITSAAEIVATGTMTPEQAAEHIISIANQSIAENAQ